MSLQLNFGTFLEGLAASKMMFFKVFTTTLSAQTEQKTVTRTTKIYILQHWLSTLLGIVF